MRPRTPFVLFVFLLFLIGSWTSVSANVLPRGTVLHIRTTQPIHAESVRVGSRVRGVVYRPVYHRRRVIIPSGSPATLEVVSRSSNRSQVSLVVRSIRADGNRFTVATNEVRLGGRTGAGRGPRGLAGAGLGAAAGGMIGGGTGAAVGATTGAMVGAASGSGRSRLSVPSNTRLQFRTR